MAGDEHNEGKGAGKRRKRGAGRMAARFFLPIREFETLRDESRSRLGSIKYVWKQAFERRKSRPHDEAALLGSLDADAKRVVVRAARVIWGAGVVCFALGIWQAIRLLGVKEVLPAFNFALAAAALCVVGAALCLRSARDYAMVRGGEVVPWRTVLMRPRLWWPFGSNG